MSYKNILVTGGCGFIGSHLVEELIKNKAKIISLDISDNPKSYFFLKRLNKKSKFVKANIRDFNQVKKVINTYRPDFIFHLAAEAIVEKAFANPLRALETNIMGTANILEAARNFQEVKGVIVASSDKAYGKLSEGMHQTVRPEAKSRFNREKYKETDPLAGDHPYEVSKSACDLISSTYYKTYGLPIVITRFGNVYGEGDLNFSRIIPDLIKSIAKKETLKIRSNGKFVRNYIYVKDVVKGYLLLAKNIKKVKGEAFNFGSDEEYSVIELIKLVEKILKKKVNYKILNTSKNEIPYQSLDYSKIQRTLGWKPKFSLKKTLKDILLWYVNFFKNRI